MTYCFVSITVLFSSFGFGQVDIINMYLTNKSVDIFYVGVDNRILLQTGKSDLEYQVMVKGAGSAIHNFGRNDYWITVKTIDSCLVTVVNKQGKKVLIRKYSTALLSPLLPTINGLRDTTIKKARILLNPFIVTITPGCYYNYGNTIHSFDAIFITGTDSTTTHAVGKMLSQEQLSMVKDLDHRDEIYFDNIRATNRDCRSFKLPSFWIKIE